MRLTMIAVGRARPGVFTTLLEHYTRRLRWSLALREIDVRTESSARIRRRNEGAKLLSAIPQGASVLALDETGRDLDSQQLATWIGRLRDGGSRDLAIVIGGADGLDPTVIQRADLVLSLGRVTWPHLLVRGLITEQIYRAETILSGHPYHRD